MSITVRQATIDDAARMAEIHIAAWRTAYEGVMPADFLAGLSHDRFTAGWTRDLETPAEGAEALLGLVDDVTQAICLVGPFRDRASNQDPEGELWMINCHPEAFGAGVATAVHTEAIANLARRFNRAALWVEQGNSRARRFYAREGWAATDITKEENFGDAAVVEVRYEIDLNGR